METYTQRIRREAVEEGRRIGLQEAKLEGRLEERAVLIAMLVRDGSLSLEKIADLYGITVDEVRSYASRGTGATSQSPFQSSL